MNTKQWGKLVTLKHLLSHALVALCPISGTRNDRFFDQLITGVYGFLAHGERIDRDVSITARSHFAQHTRIRSWMKRNLNHLPDLRCTLTPRIPLTVGRTHKHTHTHTHTQQVVGRCTEPYTERHVHYPRHTEDTGWSECRAIRPSWFLVGCEVERDHHNTTMRRRQRVRSVRLLKTCLRITSWSSAVVRRVWIELFSLLQPRRGSRIKWWRIKLFKDSANNPTNDHNGWTSHNHAMYPLLVTTLAPKPTDTPKTCTIATDARHKRDCEIRGRAQRTIGPLLVGRLVFLRWW